MDHLLLVMVVGKLFMYDPPHFCYFVYPKIPKRIAIFITSLEFVSLISCFVISYVQTVSFLTYLLKSFADYIKQHEESICKSIVNLLVTCSDSVSIRKVGFSCSFMCVSLFSLFKLITVSCWLFRNYW